MIPEYERFNAMHEITNNMVKQLIHKREQQIIQRLNAAGHFFANQYELAKFAETRLTMATFEDKPEWRELYLDYGTPDQILVASWWNTIEAQFNDPAKFEIIAGKRP